MHQYKTIVSKVFMEKPNFIYNPAHWLDTELPLPEWCSGTKCAVKRAPSPGFDEDNVPCSRDRHSLRIAVEGNGTLQSHPHRRKLSEVHEGTNWIHPYCAIGTVAERRHVRYWPATF